MKGAIRHSQSDWKELRVDPRGEDVEKQRKVTENNALDIRNLDGAFTTFSAC